MRGRQGSFHSTCPPSGRVVLRPQNADTCKEDIPCLRISKWDIGLIVSLVQSKEDNISCFDSGNLRAVCTVQPSLVPEPIIVQEADVVHGLDESLSCHVCVSHSDCGKANYRWLNVPFFSAFWCTARPYTELKGRNVVCQMEAATNCSAQIPHIFFRRPQPPTAF